MGHAPGLDVAPQTGSARTHALERQLDGGKHVPQLQLRRDAKLLRDRGIDWIPFRDSDVRVDLACGLADDGRWHGWVGVRIRADALRRLGEITGETSIEDLLTEIFSRFCVGK